MAYEELISASHDYQLSENNEQTDVSSEQTDEELFEKPSDTEPTPDDMGDIPQNEEPQEPPPAEEITVKRTRSGASASVLSMLLSVAKQEVGYFNDGANTKYTGLFDYNGPEEWSAEFLTWCVASIGETLSVQLGGDMFPWSDSVADCFLWFISHGQFDDSGEFTPWGGDYVFLDLDTDGQIDRVGIVTETKFISTLDLYGNEKRKTVIGVICGNMPKSKKIELFEIDVTDRSISGFGIIE